MEGSRASKILWLLLYAVLTGIAVALFSMIDGMIKYFFSLAGLYLIIKYFKRGDTIAYRISYILLSLVVYFLFIVVFVTYTYMKENYSM